MDRASFGVERYYYCTVAILEAGGSWCGGGICSMSQSWATKPSMRGNSRHYCGADTGATSGEGSTTILGVVVTSGGYLDCCVQYWCDRCPGGLCVLDWCVRFPPST